MLICAAFNVVFVCWLSIKRGKINWHCCVIYKKKTHFVLCVLQLLKTLHYIFFGIYALSTSCRWSHWSYHRKKRFWKCPSIDFYLSPQWSYSIQTKIESSLWKKTNSKGFCVRNSHTFSYRNHQFHLHISSSAHWAVISEAKSDLPPPDCVWQNFQTNTLTFTSVLRQTVYSAAHLGHTC